MYKELAFAEPQAKAKTVFDNLDVSEATRKDYSARVGLFLSYVSGQGFNSHSLLSFKRYLERRSDYSIATRNKYLATARILLKELVRCGAIPSSTVYSIKQFKQSKRHKREGLSASEIRLLSTKLKFLPDTPRNCRLRMLFSFLAFQGLRQIEVIRLDVNDVNLDRKTALIRGKGEDDKEIIYLTPATVKTLREYFKLCRPNGALFSSMSNRKKDRLSTRTIKREFQTIFSELGYEKTVHGFRHFYITELLKSMDMRDVRKFSRHRSMEMLIVYDDEILLKEKAKQAFQVMEKFDLAR